MKTELVKFLKLPVDDSLLEVLGFTDYDDEHCTWGNRRLMVHDSGQWPNCCYKLQIIEYGDYPEDNDPE